MAELVGAFAASHAPLIARDWEILPVKTKQRITAAFNEMRSRISAVSPDILIILSPDHWVNFFLDNLPAFCIGIGVEHGGPPEPFLAPKFPHQKIPGDPDFGLHLAETALQNSFEPSLSHNVRLDHGFCIPLWQLELETIPFIVPIFVNELEKPMPSIQRCFEWGRMIKVAINSYPKNKRIAILGSGGLSHSIGEPTMGEIDERFDRNCIELFSSADEATITATLNQDLKFAGNGSEEVRSWVIAHSAMNCRGFELIDYEPVPEVYVGCGWAEWSINTR
jgi:aromatic ring-opening dioxygenase catalytic subunit (LigB family)